MARLGPARHVRQLPLLRPPWTRTSSARFWRRSRRRSSLSPSTSRCCSRPSPTLDLEREVRELAAATVVHVITPKDGNVDAPLRFSEDVVQLRLAMAKIVGRGRRRRARVPRAVRRGLRAPRRRSEAAPADAGRRDRRLARQPMGRAAQGGLRQEEDRDVHRRRGGRHLPLRRGPDASARCIPSPRSRWPGGSSRCSRSSTISRASAIRTRERSPRSGASAAGYSDVARRSGRAVRRRAVGGAGPGDRRRRRRRSRPTREVTIAARAAAPLLTSDPGGAAARARSSP